MIASQAHTPASYTLILFLLLTQLFVVGCSKRSAAGVAESSSFENKEALQSPATLRSTFTLESAIGTPNNDANLAQNQEATNTPLPLVTASPTTEPRLEPTIQPTIQPIIQPTIQPTLEPTIEPIIEPTLEPTVEPIIEPIIEPTIEPTPEPRLEPTIQPTLEPTIEPTVTSSPTIEPTGTPSLTPSATSSPTLTPSPTMTATPHPEAEIEIKIEPGQTIEEIAHRFGVSVEDLVAYNGLENAEAAPPHEYTIHVPIGEARVAAMHATATAVVQIKVPELVVLNMTHDFQKRNNCAPATTSMVLNVLGVEKTQLDMADLQKPVPSDVNVTAEEVAVSIREVGIGAYVGINGDTPLIERLLAAGFPIMTEEWMPYDEGMGHFRAIRGYDHNDDTILYNDSYYGAELWRSYNNFLKAWKPFNNKFVVPYHPKQEGELKEIIGPNWDQITMYEGLRATSQAQIEADPSDPYAWWGLGEALVKLGRPAEAVEAFEQAIATNTLPWRYMWYRYGYFEALNQVGRHEELLAITLPTLNQMGQSEDLRYHRAVALNALGRPEEAKAELQQALWENPRFVPASHLLSQLQN